MNIVGIDFESIADGEGVRVVVYVAGCLHKCEGCHNPDAWSFSAGQYFTPDLQKEVVEYIKNTPYISGLTISGGDPVYSIVEVIDFLEAVRDELPGLDVWMYTGFAFEDLLHVIEGGDKLLSLVDVVVDGRFDISRRGDNLPYRGSSNQRIIDVRKSIQRGEVIGYVL